MRTSARLRGNFSIGKEKVTPMATKQKIVFRQTYKEEGTPVYVVVELFNSVYYKVGESISREEIITLIGNGVEVVIR